MSSEATSVTRIKERRIEEKERRRESIIDAAERVFAATGFDAATVDDIAESARVSRALVYVYFRSKMELHLAICVRALNLLRDRLVSVAFRHSGGYARVVALARAYLRFSRDEPSYFQALYRLQTRAPDTVKESSLESVVFAARRGVYEIIVDALVLGVRDGTVRKDLGDPLLAALSLWGSVHGVIQLAHAEAHFLTQAGATRARYASFALEHCLRGLR